MQDFARIDAIQAEYEANKLQTQQGFDTTCGRQNAAAAAPAAFKACDGQQADMQAAHGQGSGVSAVPATAACTAQQASGTASGQQRPALAQLSLVDARSGFATAHQLAAGGAHAAAGAAGRQNAVAAVPQGSARSTGWGPLQGPGQARQHAEGLCDDAGPSEADGCSPVLIDVATTTGGIQLHRCERISSL